MADLGPLHKATRDLHHAVEQTSFGMAMASGRVSSEAWTTWLKALYEIHSVVDRWAPVSLQRSKEVEADLLEMHKRGFKEVSLQSPTIFANSITEEQKALGAVYVLGGAHVMGGAIIRNRMNGRLPCSHITYEDEDRRNAVAAVKSLRDSIQLADYARDCFSTLLLTCQEIEKSIVNIEGD